MSGATSADDFHGGSRRSYMAGTALAVLLTGIPFALVMTRVLPPEATIAGIFAAAVVQIAVHLHYFLHLDTRSGGGWNLPAIVYTAIIVAIVVGGSVWIMAHLADNTMLHGAALAATHGAVG